MKSQGFLIFAKWREDSSTFDSIFPPAQGIDSIALNPLPLYRNPTFLQENYVEKGLSIKQISAQIFSSKEAVRMGLERAGIPIREVHKPHSRPSQPAYGTRIIKQTLGPHKTEQRVIDAVLEMKAQGLGLRAIARTLSDLKIPTKLQGKAWHPEMVSRILERSLNSGT